MRNGGGTSDAVGVRRRPGGRSAVVKTKVRTATLDLLEEVGYERLQLTEVAARAGVNKTTVYRRWPTKLQLVAEHLGDIADDQVPVPDTGSLQRDLEVMLGHVAEILRLPVVRGVIRAVITLADDDREIDEVRRRFWEKQFDDAADIVSRAIERGELPRGTDAGFFLERVFGPLYFRLLITGHEVSPAELRALASLRGPTQ